MKENKLTRLGRILLSSKRHKYRQLFQNAGYDDIPYGMIGKAFVGTLLVTLIWWIYILVSSEIYLYGAFFIIAGSILFFTIVELVVLLAGIIISRLYLDVRSYSRMQNIEQNLPLFLRELSTNLKAGREFVDALEDSLTPQLGALNLDIQKMVVDIRSGKIVEAVLRDYSRRYDSYALNETFEIILDSYRGGGGLSEIIDRIADNLEVIHYLKKNAIASVSNYIIFTSLVALIIAPILFALSFNLLWLVDKLLHRLVVTGSSQSFLKVATSLKVDFEDFKLFSRLAVAAISGSAASIITLIRKGSLRGSPVVILMFIGIALVCYQIAFIILEHLFRVLFQLY